MSAALIVVSFCLFIGLNVGVFFVFLDGLNIIHPASP